MNNLKQKIKQKIDKINWTELILSMIRDLVVGLILILADRLIN